MAWLVAGLFAVLLLLYLGARYHAEPANVDRARFNELVSAEAVKPDFVEARREPCANRSTLRNAYFGALHIHTALSGDASAWGNVATPSDAYAFARGAPLDLRMRGDKPEDAPVIRLGRPLDFAAVTDHAEYLGETHLCLTPGSSAYGSMRCRFFRGDLALPFAEEMGPILRLASFVAFTERSARICGDDGMNCIRASVDVWRESQRAAEAAYDRTGACSFTSFVGYEFSLAKEASNLHRNVIFGNGTVPPTPLSAKEAHSPEELWQWLEAICTRGDSGCDVLTIPHNSNWSNGRMFFPYSLSDRPDAEKRRLVRLRSEMEPLVEILQVKGDSECRNNLSRVIGAPDELCDFEKLRDPREETEDCGDSFGSGGMRLSGCLSRWSYVRYGLIEGLREQETLGVNSLKLGIIAASDNHTGVGGAVDEGEFPGSTGLDRTPRGRLRDPVEIPGGVAKGDAVRYNPGGIAGVWAEENTRESIFAAMKRRETFGTSGPRIKPRFFGGWDYDAWLCDHPDLLERSYAGGVPMGGDLKPAPTQDASPRFLVTAEMDSASSATPLQKLQVIKGWIDSKGNMQQRVFDVAGDHNPTGSVDIESCQVSGEGHVSLCTVWLDPDFDASQSAVYYARVVENPSCRWSTYDCNAIPEADRPDACLREDISKTIQERAWTSPIWYRGDS
jgi:hypothetical protein